MTDTVRIVDHDPVAPLEEGLLTQLAACPWEAGRQLAANVERGEFFEPGDVLCLATIGDTLVGFATLASRGCVPGDARSPWLGFVYCAEDMRGRGVARSLVEHVRTLAAERGAGEILVASSMAERGFYAACGFREVGEATAFWGEPVMVCALPCGPDAS